MSKTYAVTGVASGIGAKLAHTLKSQGHQVVGLDHFIALDLNDDASILAAAARTPCKLDGLCNNAGLPPRAGMEAAILQVNFIGTRAFTHAMLPHMAQGASIVNMASRAGHGWRDNLDQNKRLATLRDAGQASQFVREEGIDATRCYNLTKEAVILWTVAVAEEMVAKGLRINSLSPGGIGPQCRTRRAARRPSGGRRYCRLRLVT